MKTNISERNSSSGIFRVVIFCNTCVEVTDASKALVMSNNPGRLARLLAFQCLLWRDYHMIFVLFSYTLTIVVKLVSALWVKVCLVCIHASVPL